MNAAEKFKLNPEKQTLFVFGGSQGSEALNKHIASNLTQYKHIQILWQTGKGNSDDYKYLDSNTVRVLPFIDNMKFAYAMADLVISRAGALTIAELTTCGLPAILIPLPSAAGDHQTSNANAMKNNGAAKLIPESELNAENSTEIVLSLLNDTPELQKMANCSGSLGKPQATSHIAEDIMKRINA